MTSAADSNPRIYVACLAAYNNGHLYGAWIDADQDANEIRDEIAAMLARSPIKGAEEYAIHDYEGFEGVPIKEYASIDSVARMGAFIAEHGALAPRSRPTPANAAASTPSWSQPAMPHRATSAI